MFLSLVIREALQKGNRASGSRRDWGIQLEVKGVGKSKRRDNAQTVNTGWLVCEGFVEGVVLILGTPTCEKTDSFASSTS